MWACGGSARLGRRGPARRPREKGSRRQRLTRRNLRHAKTHSEDREPAGLALDLDAPAHRERQLLHDREPETRADLPLEPVTLVEVEALERALHVVLREARSGVLDAQDARVGDDSNLAARRRQAQRVLDEVRDDLENAVGIADRGRGTVGDSVQRDAEALCLRLLAADSILGHLGEVDIGVVDAEVGAVHPRQVEQVVDESLEAPRL